MYLKIATYRDRERKWREEAAQGAEGISRQACLELADGYAHLVAILERLAEPDGGADHRHIPPSDGDSFAPHLLGRATAALLWGPTFTLSPMSQAYRTRA
jgi:hypothetical protein